jgi:hypothetical protein
MGCLGRPNDRAGEIDDTIIHGRRPGRTPSPTLLKISEFVYIMDKKGVIHDHEKNPFAAEF